MPDDTATTARDSLYALPVADFVVARDALVHRLRVDGVPEEAATVKGLRRPTLAAWAVNQVVRRHADRWAALVAAGSDAQRAQRRALSGVRDSGLREAMATRRELVEELTELAAAALTDAGARPSSHLGDIAATLEAASADPTVAEQVGRAQLSTPVRLDADFATAGILATVPAASTGSDRMDDGPSGRTETANAEQRRAAMRRLDEARARAARSADTASAARVEARTRARDAATARVAATAARQAADDACAAADRAAAVADETTTRALAAEEAAEAATAAAADDARAVDDARTALDRLA